jgi:hypothetical protein
MYETYQFKSDINITKKELLDAKQCQINNAIKEGYDYNAKKNLLMIKELILKSNLENTNNKVETMKELVNKKKIELVEKITENNIIFNFIKKEDIQNIDYILNESLINKLNKLPNLDYNIIDLLIELKKLKFTEDIIVSNINNTTNVIDVTNKQISNINELENIIWNKTKKLLNEKIKILY